MIDRDEVIDMGSNWVVVPKELVKKVSLQQLTSVYTLFRGFFSENINIPNQHKLVLKKFIAGEYKNLSMEIILELWFFHKRPMADFVIEQGYSVSPSAPDEVNVVTTPCSPAEDSSDTVPTDSSPNTQTEAQNSTTRDLQDQEPSEFPGLKPQGAEIQQDNDGSAPTLPRQPVTWESLLADQPEQQSNHRDVQNGEVVKTQSPLHIVEKPLPGLSSTALQLSQPPVLLTEIRPEEVPISSLHDLDPSTVQKAISNLEKHVGEVVAVVALPQRRSQTTEKTLFQSEKVSGCQKHHLQHAAEPMKSCPPNLHQECMDTITEMRNQEEGHFTVNTQEQNIDS